MNWFKRKIKESDEDNAYCKEEASGFHSTIDFVKSNLIKRNKFDKLALLNHVIDIVKLDLMANFQTELIYSSHEPKPIETFLSYYFDKDGQNVSIVSDNLDNRVCVDISKSTVLSRTWRRDSLVNAILNVSKNGFEYMNGNQLSYYYPYMNICIMHNGMHHVAVASVKKQGYTKASIANIEESFPHVYTDGEYWYNTHTKQKIEKLHNFRLGLIFELYKLKHHVTYYDIPSHKSETHEFVITDIEEIKKKPENIIYLRQDLITYELCLTVFKNMKECGWYFDTTYLQVVPTNLHDAPLCKLAVEINSDNIKFALKEILNYDICTLAVEGNADNIQYVPAHLLDYELCKLCVSKKPDNIRLIPEDFITGELCVLACSYNLLNLFVIPQQHLNKELLCSSFKSVSDSVSLIHVWRYIASCRSDIFSEENISYLAKELSINADDLRVLSKTPVPYVLDDIVNYDVEE